MTKYLFVGGPEHGKIQSAHPDHSGIWVVAHRPPLSITRGDTDVTHTYIEQSMYVTRELFVFGEAVTILAIDGEPIPSRVLDAMIRPEVRDLFYIR